MNEPTAPSLDRLLSGLVDQSIDDRERRHLNRRLADDPNARARYIRYMDLHAELARRGGALRADKPAVLPFRRVALWAAALAAAALLTWVSWPERRAASPIETVGIPVPHARLLEEDRAVWRSVRPPQPGDALPPGPLHLSSGRARIRLRVGVDVWAEGPTSLEIPDKDKQLKVSEGRLVLKVEPEAKGFVVRLPGGSVKDLGTLFALDVAVGEPAEVHVFQGHVFASTGSEASVTLGAEEAAVLRAEGPKVMRASPWRFAQTDLSRRPIPVHGTGVGLEPGQADPNWNLVAVEPPDALPYRGPASVVWTLSNRGPYFPNNPRHSQWISAEVNRRNYPDRSRYTFETTFRMDGLDPTTAKINGALLADNRVLSIHLNDTDVPVPKQAEHRFVRLRRFVIERGFEPGLNRLRFVVENSWGRGDPRSGPSAMALRVELRGSAEPLR
ncbi:MAG: hypothetical protein R3236_10345 [Phycisphaeraceae bacterium]|nr:hypothetical protein [Phycisphaeraceae bacterium]